MPATGRPTPRSLRDMYMMEMASAELRRPMMSPEEMIRILGLQNASPELKEKEKPKLTAKQKRTAEDLKKKMTKKIDDSQYLAEGVSLTIMAVRERLMKYFKGSCVQDFAKQAPVRLLTDDSSSGRHYYERRERENQQRSHLYIGGEIVASVSKEPDMVVFYPGVVNRSPEFQAIYESVKLFLEEYLMGVQYKEDPEASWNSINSGGRGDKSMLLALGKRVFQGAEARDPYDPRGGYVTYFDSETAGVSSMWTSI